MLLHLLRPPGLAREAAEMGYTLTIDQMRQTASFYADRTVHDSSLSLIGSAGARVPFNPGVSWTLFGRSLTYDDEPGKAEAVAQGLHLGAMAGVCDVLVRLYLGLDYGADELLLAPDPPPSLPPVGLGLCCRGNRFTICWDGMSVTLHADAGNRSPLPVRARSETVAIAPGQSDRVPAGTRTRRTEALAAGG